MQGAGGILVLGSVLDSIVVRMRHSQEIRNRSPDVWLKTTFLELHQVFESFGGLMMISMAMGIVEEDAGILYEINAEHPWSVMYREEQASFLCHETVLRKLGTIGTSGEATVEQFELRPGDVVVTGSDGRDDLLISNGSEEPEINMDENLFLQCVEEGRGVPERIYDAVRAKGELTDDFSILSLRYEG